MYVAAPPEFPRAIQLAATNSFVEGIAAFVFPEWFVDGLQNTLLNERFAISSVPAS
jgi:hypothetical protein